MFDAQITAFELNKDGYNVRYDQDHRPVVDEVARIMDGAPKKHGHADWAYRGSLPNCMYHTWLIDFERETGAKPGMPGHQREFNRWAIRRIHRDRECAQLRGHRW